MRVAFDSQIFCTQQFGGISRYFASLAREMAAMPEVLPLIVAPLYINDYVARLPRELVIGRKAWVGGKAKVLLAAISAAAGEFVQYRHRADIVHETYYYPQLRAPRKGRTIVSVYDMTYERYPEHFAPNDALPRWKRRTVERADHIICISEHTRNDLLEMYGMAPERVSVTYLGYDPLVSVLKEEDPAVVRTRFCGEDRPYILYVGSRTGCKNFAALVRAFSGSSWLRGNFSLICFGGGAFTAAEAALIKAGSAAGRIRQVSGPDSVLASGYRHAEVFVYPSLYEGFGIPPLEAMSLDCPVVCSNASSIPEVVGDAAEIFDPADEQAIRASLENVLGSTEVRATLVERGRKRKDLFSWERCARETVGIYKKVMTS